MGEIFRIDVKDMPWFEYQPSAGPDGTAQIRVKALTRGQPGLPPVQYVDYAPGYTDPQHRHDVDELFIVTEGEMWIDEVANGPGSLVFVPRDTEYAVRAGESGARYFRVVP